MKIETADGKVADGIEQGPFEPIAIIGIGALMPMQRIVMSFGATLSTVK